MTAGIGDRNVWLAYVVAFAVPRIVTLETREPPPAALIASRQISTVPALPPAVPPDVAERDPVDVQEVERSVQLDPVARTEAAALEPAADVGRGPQCSCRTG